MLNAAHRVLTAATATTTSTRVRVESLRLVLRLTDRVPKTPPTNRTALRFVRLHEVDGTIVPGMPEQSQLWAGAHGGDRGRRPPVGREWMRRRGAYGTQAAAARACAKQVVA